MDDATAAVDGTQAGNPIPDRPPVSTRLRTLVDKLWKDTNDVPDHKDAVSAAREAQKTLFPAEFDKNDRFRGKTPFELRTRQDDRRVRTNLVYRNVLQTVAMTVPDDHGVKWDPIPQIQIEQPLDPLTGASLPPPPDPAAKLADTILPVVKHYAAECGFQEIAQGAVQDASQYRLAIIKLVFDRDYVTDTIKTHAEGPDAQENIQRLRVLVEDFERKQFREEDPEYEEMQSLKEALGISDEIKLWKGLRAELVPIDCFRFDPGIRGYEQIYQASWMSHDVMMTIEDIRAKYPFKLLPDGQFTGVHPDDIQTAQKNTAGTSRPSSDGTTSGSNQDKGKGPSSKPDSRYEIDRLLVREVWSKRLNRVYVLIDGIDYPAAQWVPEKTPKQWYPFRCLRLNRVTGQVYGFSDVELQAEMQHRINRKRSDEEKARWLSLPRGVYNTQGVDQQEILKMRDHLPGEWKGLNLGMAKSIKEVMESYQFNFDPGSFDTQADYGEMRSMASLPQELLGNSESDTKFASQVAAATQGAAIASNARGNIIRVFLEGTYNMMAEILLQELEPEEMQEVAGPGAFCPHIYSEAEGKKLAEQTQMEAETEIQQAEMAAQQQAEMAALNDIQMGIPPQNFVPLDEIAQEQAMGEAVAQKNMAVFGWPEPVTRESLFRRLKCKVTVALNTAADRQQRLQGIQALFASIQMGAQAAQSAGLMFDPMPLLKQAAVLFNGDEDLKKMFMPAPLLPPGGLPGQPSQPGLPPEVAGAQAPQDGGGSIDAPVNSPNTAINPVKAQGQPV